jgi:hypothetical protein
MFYSGEEGTRRKAEKGKENRMSEDTNGLGDPEYGDKEFLHFVDRLDARAAAFFAHEKLIVSLVVVLLGGMGLILREDGSLRMDVALLMLSYTGITLCLHWIGAIRGVEPVSADLTLVLDSAFNGVMGEHADEEIEKRAEERKRYMIDWRTGRHIVLVYAFLVPFSFAALYSLVCVFHQLCCWLKCSG